MLLMSPAPAIGQITADTATAPGLDRTPGFSLQILPTGRETNGLFGDSLLGWAAVAEMGCRLGPPHLHSVFVSHNLSQSLSTHRITEPGLPGKKKIQKNE